MPKKPNGKGPDQAESAPNPDEKATADQRPNGQFAKGNKLGHRFPPGNNANGAGRPSKPSMVAAICKLLTKADAKALEGVPLFDEDGKPKRAPTIEELGANLLHMAMGGNITAMTALTTLLDRLDGRVPIKAELTGKDGDPIEIRSARDSLLSRIDSQAAKVGEGTNPRRPN